MDANLLPNLIIAGFTKAATTSLFTYLSWHPEICASDVKEPKYFLPLLNGNQLPVLKEYSKHFRNCRNSKYRLESSPGYIFGGKRLAQAVKDHLGSIRIIVLLRDPASRLFSYYKHAKRDNQLPEDCSFDRYVNTGLEELKEANYRPTNVYYGETVFVRGIGQAFYSEYLDDWFTIFQDSLRVYFFEDLKQDPLSFMIELCEWLDVDPSVYRSVEFTVENRGIRYKNKTFHQFAQFVNNEFEIFLRRHHGLKKFLRTLYCLSNEAPNCEDVVSESTTEALKLAYAPYNEELVSILACRGYCDFPEWLNRTS